MKYFILIFLAWISFFPQPVHVHYSLYTKMFLAAAFLVLLWKDKTRGLFDRKDIFFILFLMFLSFGILGVRDRSAALENYSDIMVTFFCFYYFSKYSLSYEKNMEVFFKALSVFALVLGVFGIFEYIIGKNFIYENIIHNAYYPWYSSVFISGRRPMATLFNPVILGTYLLVSLPFSLYLIKDKNFFFRITGIISFILGISVIILCRSRGVFISMTALFLFYLWNKKKPLAVVFLSLIICSITLCSFSASRVFNRFGFHRMIFGQSDSVFSEYRFKRAGMALSMAKDHPFFGVGLGNFRSKFDEYNPDKGEREMHVFKIADNMYLTILAESGIFAFLVFLIFMFYLFRRGISCIHRAVSGEDKAVSLVVVSSFIALSVNMAAYELFYWHTSFTLFCIICGAINRQSCDLKKDYEKNF